MLASKPLLRPGRAARGSAGSVRRLAIESLEGRVVMTGAGPDLGLFAATTIDSRSVTFSFTFERGNLNPAVAGITVGIYRSSDPTYGPGDLEVATGTLDLTARPGRVTLPLAKTLQIDPARPFIVVVGDPQGTLGEEDTGNNADAFRMHTIGAVSHGFSLFPGDSDWVDQMAESLPYDVKIPFHWDSYSFLPVPGMTVLAGWALAGAVVSAASQLVASPTFEAGDVIALHAIGHSRGSVVISQAGLDLEALGGLTPALAALQAGPLKLTFLDAHPANNLYAGKLFSAAPNFIGGLATAVHSTFNALARDPNVVVPASADWAEVYYQRTSYRDAVTPTEQFFLHWGQSLKDIEIRGARTVLTERNLSKDVPSHVMVQDWYQENIVPTLGGTAAAPGHARSTAAPPAGFVVVPLGEPADLFRQRRQGRARG